MAHPPRGSWEIQERRETLERERQTLETLADSLSTQLQLLREEHRQLAVAAEEEANRVSAEKTQGLGAVESRGSQTSPPASPPQRSEATPTSPPLLDSASSPPCDPEAVARAEAAAAEAMEKLAGATGVLPMCLRHDGPNYSEWHEGGIF